MNLDLTLDPNLDLTLDPNLDLELERDNNYYLVTSNLKILEDEFYNNIVDDHSNSTKTIQDYCNKHSNLINIILENSFEDPEIQTLKGIYYQYSINTHQDNERAIKCFLEASEKNYIPAYSCLGDFYFSTAGALAVYFYKKAVNYPRSMNKLGICYSQGYGVTQDNIAAHIYFKKAVDQG